MTTLMPSEQDVLLALEDPERTLWLTLQETSMSPPCDGLAPKAVLSTLRRLQRLGMVLQRRDGCWALTTLGQMQLADDRARERERVRTRR